MLREMEGVEGGVLTFVSQLRKIITINLLLQAGTSPERGLQLEERAFLVLAAAAGGSTVHPLTRGAASFGTGPRQGWSEHKHVLAATPTPWELRTGPVGRTVTGSQRRRHSVIAGQCDWPALRPRC